MAENAPVNRDMREIYLLDGATVTYLASRWDAEGIWRRDAMRADRGDTRQPRDQPPRFQHPADRAAALASGAVA